MNIIRCYRNISKVVDADYKSSGRNTRSLLLPEFDPCLAFVKWLRIAEGLKCVGWGGRLFYYIAWIRLERLRRRYSFTIPLGVFSAGLSVAHIGSIVVNKNARVGANCRIHPGVCIGGGPSGVPVIGRNVYIGPGAKIYGGIVVGDDAVIGANAVVNISIPQGSLAVGVPCRIIAKVAHRYVIPGDTLVDRYVVNWDEYGPAEALGWGVAMHNDKGK